MYMICTPVIPCPALYSACNPYSVLSSPFFKPDNNYQGSYHKNALAHVIQLILCHTHYSKLIAIAMIVIRVYRPIYPQLFRSEAA